MDLFKLVGSIFIDNDAANDSLAKTDEKAQKTGKSFKDVAGSAAKVGAAAVGAATALSGAVLGMASDSASSMDVIDKASQRMNITAESYQELAHAASLSGVEMSTMEKAAKKLEGTDLDLDQALDQIYALETAEERSAKAAELFGESVAYQMSPMLNASGKDFKAMRKEANDLGLVMSGDTVAAGAKLNDQLSNVKDSANALMTEVGTSLMPIVGDFADMILEYMPMIHGLIENLTPIIQDMFQQIVPPLMELIRTLLPILFQFIEMLLPPLTQIISAILPVFASLLSAIMPVIANIAETIMPILVQLLGALEPILTPILSLLTPILELVNTLLTPLLDLINLVLPPIISLVTEIAGFLSGALGDAINGAIEIFQKLRDKAGEIFENLKEKIRGPVNTIIGFINGLISGVTSGINAVIRAINSVHIDVPDWLANLTGIQTIGFNLKELVPWQIPLLAQGGEVEGSAIVGEDGPELLQTNGKKTMVTPLNDNNNAFVELSKKVDMIFSLLNRGFGVYIDGSSAVGVLGPALDQELGVMAALNERGV